MKSIDQFETVIELVVFVCEFDYPVHLITTLKCSMKEKSITIPINSMG